MMEQATRWCLTGRTMESSAIQNVDIDSTPFQIGRREGLSLSLPRPAVSNLHAEIVTEGDFLSIRDLQSTNGTFVNGQRVHHEMPLQAGDLIQFADVAFRVNQREVVASPRPEIYRPATPEVIATPAEPDSATDTASFIEAWNVIPHYDPIVSLEQRVAVGYEVLARGNTDGYRTPKEMFLAAAKLNVHVELSRMLRVVGLKKGAAINDSRSLFLNTHPAEIAVPGLIESLSALRDADGRRRLALELREPSGADTDIIRQLSESLKNLGINLAYDDFGSGKTRRAELAAVRPDYVKFAMHLIRDIHMAPAAQHRLLANLVRMVRDLGIVTIALGVECEAEHAVCCDLGFELGQGYYYGRPSAVGNIATGLNDEYAFI